MEKIKIRPAFLSFRLSLLLSKDHHHKNGAAAWTVLRHQHARLGNSVPVLRSIIHAVFSVYCVNLMRIVLIFQLMGQVARVSAFSFGAVYGSVKLKVLKVLFLSLSLSLFSFSFVGDELK